MAKMITCQCGWTLISPLGEADVIRHTQLHLTENHPGTSVTPMDLARMIKSV
jgi:hypothetical protein